MANNVTVDNNDLTDFITETEDQGGGVHRQVVKVADVVSLSTVGDGSKDITTAGTAEALGSDVAVKEVWITANDDNTGKVYVGTTTVSSTRGLKMFPGQTHKFTVSNLNLLYLDVDTNGEGVTFTYFS